MEPAILDRWSVKSPRFSNFFYFLIWFLNRRLGTKSNSLLWLKLIMATANTTLCFRWIVISVILLTISAESLAKLSENKTSAERTPPARPAPEPVKTVNKVSYNYHPNGKRHVLCVCFSGSKWPSYRKIWIIFKRRRR